MQLTFETTAIAGVLQTTRELVRDSRGSFERLYCSEQFRSTQLGESLQQINLSRNSKKGTVRGLHYQVPPSEECKLVTCLSGAILDYVVDLRQGSPTFLQHAKLELRALEPTSLLIPPGVAHGFQTLEDDTTILYFHSDFFSTEFEHGVRFDDPLLSLSLPLEISEISQRDCEHPLLAADFTGVAV